MARFSEREDRIEQVGGIRVGHRRPPVWLILLIAAIVGWGVWYLITYSISDVGTFQAPGGAGALGPRG